MARNLFFLILLLFQISVYAQPLPKPMPENIFLQELNRLKMTRPEQKKLTMACDLVRRNSILSIQAKKVAALFANDYFRLEFMQCIYTAVYDQENIYDLYDSFSSFSAAMRFHDFMEAQSPRQKKHGRYRDAYGRDYSFPEYDYPTYSNYNELSLCDRPINEDEFDEAVIQILSLRDDDARIMAATRIAEANCLTVSQIMKLGSIIEKEQKRLEYLKRSYDRAYDVNNYSYGNQLFKEKVYLNEFDTFVKDRRSRNVRDENRDRRQNTSNCRIGEQEMQEIIGSVKRQSFENTRLESVKQVVRAKQCFSVYQVKQLLELFTFENNRLDLAKFCYNYCTEKSDYYKLNSSFTFSGSVDELNKFIQSQR
jgi:hypothetical protein